MKKAGTISVLLMASFIAAPVMAEPQPGRRVDPAPKSVTTADTEGEKAAVRVMNKFARCVANRNPTRAAELLRMPYLSVEQLNSISSLVGGEEDCLGIGNRELRFKPPALLGGLAEELVSVHYKRADVIRYAGMSDTAMDAAGLSPRNLSEDFGQCVVRRAPASSLDLIQAIPASPAEGTIIRTLVPHLGPCFVEGGSISLNAVSVRSIIAVGLYRLLTASNVSRGS